MVTSYKKTFWWSSNILGPAYNADSYQNHFIQRFYNMHIVANIAQLIKFNSAKKENN